MVQRILDCADDEPLLLENAWPALQCAWATEERKVATPGRIRLGVASVARQRHVSEFPMYGASDVGRPAFPIGSTAALSEMPCGVLGKVGGYAEKQ
jgi:hypothetical protein